jgi:predicted TPR repeat methyltransferase
MQDDVAQAESPGGVSPAEALAFAVQLHRNRQLRAAAEVYQRVLRVVPDQPDALHFLGVICHQIGRSDEAIRMIRRSLEVQPDHADARNNLGNVLKESGRLAEAEAVYREAIALRPDHAGAYSNLGVVLKDLERHDEAVAAFERALAIDPTYGDAQHNLGTVLMAMSRHEEGLTAYRRAIELRPYHSEAYNLLGRALHRAGRVAECESVFRTWVRRDPDNPIARHMLAACTGQAVPERASDGYVQRTFDGFSGCFDQVLTRLEYRAPEMIAATLAEGLPAPGKRDEVLDAGCGTGLCGPVLAPYARRLVGVDLSPGMLDKARGRDLYDELIQAELTEHLARHPAAYDLIAFADTLVYFGDLAAVFEAASGALRPGGHAVFTVESGAHDGGASRDGFRLLPHGRYCHSEAYLRRALGAAGLSVRTVGSGTVRREAGDPVAGFVVLARKGA